ncbi:MAG TPA: xanthine dehydrogenase family protein molybdopterin-binding subunit [Bacteroidales bacterium]|nr:xanthine dehydrogenase family protein molybdopterin-binding subunit [Bacteroidales bacterium]
MSTTLFEKSVSRKEFLKVSGATGAALLLGFIFPFGSRGKEAILKNISAEEVLTADLTPFIIIDSSNKITLMLHKPEMGQGTYQSMPVILAEELDVTLDQVTIKPALANRKKYGYMGVGGSNSVRGSWMKLRQAGAAARTMLVTAAAQTWKVPVNECFAKEGRIYHNGSDKNAKYGDLVETAAKMSVPQNPKLKEPKDFQLIGKPIPRPDIPLKVSGSAEFGLDVKVPGMLYASVEHCPVFRGKVKSFDDTAAKAVPGVKSVIASERHIRNNKLYGVAVVADSYYAALEGRKALKIDWDFGKYENANTQDLYKDMRELTKSEGKIAKQQGDFENAYRNASIKTEALYELPFAAHAPMEPQNAVAHVQGDKCEIWASTQVPDRAQQIVAGLLNIPLENVTLHFKFMGGAYGRRLISDPITEAVFLSQKVGAPVKVAWTREDDMTLGPFRPGTVSSLKGGVDNTGKLVAFQHKVVAPSINDSMSGGPINGGKVDRGAMEGITDSPYEIPNLKIHNIYAESPVAISWWRSVYASTTSFAQESFVDEMAHVAGKDPLQFRIDMIHENKRMKNLYEFLREKSGWNKTLPDGWGKGVAAIEFFAGRAGHVVYVSKKGAGVKIERIVSAIDCGRAVNPDNVKAQVEGSIVMALTAALKDEITLYNGKVLQSNFDSYRMMRINEIPPIEVYIVPSTDKPDGVGEPGLPTLAPALGNAIFAATGKRIRKLPFNINRI